MFKVLKLPANHKFVHVHVCVCACVYLAHTSIFKRKNQLSIIKPQNSIERFDIFITHT